MNVNLKRYGRFVAPIENRLLVGAFIVCTFGFAVGEIIPQELEKHDGPVASIVSRSPDYHSHRGHRPGENTICDDTCYYIFLFLFSEK